MIILTIVSSLELQVHSSDVSTCKSSHSWYSPLLLLVATIEEPYKLILQFAVQSGDLSVFLHLLPKLFSTFSSEPCFFIIPLCCRHSWRVLE
jgi:hypothetical protein